MLPVSLVAPVLSPRRVGIIVAVASCLFAVWFIGLALFARSIPEGVVDGQTRTDAIVILTGGSLRLDTGLTLLERNMADRVFVSGVHRDVGVEELLAMVPQASPHLRCCVDTGHGAADTAGNAAETARWMRDRGYRSLRLVTAGYHMPRSLMEFRYAMPETAVIPHPVFPDEVKTERWWEWPGTAALLISEYNKLLLSWLGHAAAVVLGPADAAAGEAPEP